MTTLIARVRPYLTSVLTSGAVPCHDVHPGEIEIRLKNDKGVTVLNGTWTVQHQA